MVTIPVLPPLPCPSIFGVDACFYLFDTLHCDMRGGRHV